MKSTSADLTVGLLEMKSTVVDNDSERTIYHRHECLPDIQKFLIGINMQRRDQQDSPDWNRQAHIRQSQVKVQNLRSYKRLA